MRKALQVNLMKLKSLSILSTRPHLKEDESRTLSDEITGIIKNPFNVTNSIDSADRLRDILTDNS